MSLSVAMTARELVPEHGRLLGDGAVPALVPELVLTLGHCQPGSVPHAGQQERLPAAQLPLPGAQRQVSAAQLLRDSGGGHTQPPVEESGSVSAQTAVEAAGRNHPHLRGREFKL